MDIHSDNPTHGYQFPGEFELSAMGPAEAGLEVTLPRLLSDAGVDVLHEDVTWKPSSSGKYVSVRIRFRANNREEHERAHEVLRGHPEVKWTL
ncbi:DUF493 family protein [Lysobacter claricitrinus]|uniref:DUF493 family protein n=1 Tax=Lysobacter claricitrinus TaxID=3367728 RepID=UPI0037DB5B93